MFKKQITALGFLLLIAFPLFLSVGIVIKQRIVQNQRRERFESEFIQTITVKAEKVYWTKAGKEILVTGRLFDVESYRVSGDVLVLTGFYDHMEEKLVKHIRDLIDKKSDSRNSSNFLAIKFLFYPKYTEANNFQVLNNWKNIDRQFPVYEEILAEHTYPAPSPPPKCC